MAAKGALQCLLALTVRCGMQPAPPPDACAAPRPGGSTMFSARAVFCQPRTTLYHPAHTLERSPPPPSETTHHLGTAPMSSRLI